MLLCVQELVWHVVNNVNIPGSKAPLFARSPFLEFQAIVPERAAEMMIASAPEDKRDAMEAAVRASVDYAASVSKALQVDYICLLCAL